MSLINDMLRDLERRRVTARPPTGEGIRDAAVVTTAGSRRPRVAAILPGLLGVCLVLLLVIALGPIVIAPPKPQAVLGTMVKSGPIVLPMPAAPPTESAPPSGEPNSTSSVIVPPYEEPPQAPAQMQTLLPATRATEQTAFEPKEAAPGIAAAKPGNTPLRPTTETRPAASSPVPKKSAVQKVEPRPPVPQEPALARYQLALSSLERGSPREAEHWLREALRADFRHEPSAETLSALLVKQGRDADARLLLADLYRRGGLSPRLTVAYAHLMAGAGDSEHAVAVLERIPSREASEGHASLLAALLQRLGRHESSAEAWHSALVRDPNNGTFWAGLAVSFEALGQPVEARDAWLSALMAGGIEPALARYASSRLAALSKAGE